MGTQQKINVIVIRWRQVEGFYNPTLITQVSKCRSVKVSYKVMRIH